MGAVSIARAESADDYRDCRRFWYDVYVSEMQRHTDDADHVLGELRDPLESGGELFLARDETGQVVGTVLSAIGRFPGVEAYEELYGLSALGPDYPLATSVTKKLMVAESHRSGALAMRLCKATYVSALPQGTRFCVIDCNRERIALFERLGFRTFRSRLEHPEYGLVAVMVLDLLDEAHLRRVRSPFLPILRRHHRLTLNQLGMKELAG